MNASPSASLQLRARDLLRAPLIQLSLLELKAHASAVCMAALALDAEGARAGFMSHGDRVGMRHLANLLRAHLIAIDQLIEDQQVEAAHAEQEAGARLAGPVQPSRGAQP